MKRFLPMFLVLLLLLTPMAALGATENVKDAAIAHLQTYKMIESGTSQLADNRDGTINISGSTTTYSSVAEVGLTLHLQYLSKGNWYTVQSFNYTGNNKSSVSGGQHLAVSHGYNYRVFAEHTAYNGTTYETGYSYTEAVNIP